MYSKFMFMYPCVRIYHKSLIFKVLLILMIFVDLLSFLLAPVWVLALCLIIHVVLVALWIRAKCQLLDAFLIDLFE